ncbi:MAG: 2-hydroxyacyl-CoA dehydratase subunit D [Candidatus Freyarchaeota archaeon]
MGEQKGPAMIETLRTIFSFVKENPVPNVYHKEAIDCLFTYVDNYFNYKKQGKKIVMYNFCFTPEIFYAMDTYPLCQEALSVGLAATGLAMNEPYIDIAEESGIPKELCNAQKPLIGAYLKGDAPKPDYIIYAAQPCDSLNIEYQIYENLFKVPSFPIDVPYWHYDPQSEFYNEKTLPYLKNQLENMVEWLQKQSGYELDTEKLKKVVEMSNEAQENILEFNELMKSIPCPLPSLTPFNNYIVELTTAGTPECVEYAKKMRNQAAEKVKKKEGVVPEEKIRAVWLYTHVFFSPDLFNWMAEKFGAVVVMDMLGYFITKPINTSSTDKIFEGLAEKVLDMPMARQCRGPAEYYIDDYVKMCKEYSADCAIFSGHMACKHSWGLIKLLAESLREEVGIPTLTFEVDTMDSRPVPRPAIEARLEQFFATIM